MPWWIASFVLSLAGPQDSQRPVKVEWLSRHALALDLESGEFTDPNALSEVFDGVEVVLLGEASHGDGSAFEAKTQLVRFLHEALGFDVLMFESGMYDCARAWRRIEAGESTAAVVRDALFDVWSASAEAQPLFDYVDRCKSGEHPLELAGFDLQLTGTASQRELIAEIDALLARHELAASPEWLVAKPALQELVAGGERWIARTPVERQPAFDALESLQRKLLDAIDRSDANEAFLVQVLKNLQVLARFMLSFGGSPADRSLGSLRDPQMAENLLWLREGPLRGRKIIGWGNNGHFIRSEKLPRAGGSALATMGGPLSEVLGQRLLIVGGTACQGETGLASRGARAADRIPAATGDLLEAMLHDAGFRACLLDLRRLPDEADWLRGASDARLMGHSRTRAPWPEVLDAVFFLDEMKPSSPVSR